MNEDLTAAELVEIDLPTAMRGYRTDNVDALIDRVADALDARDSLIGALTEDRDQLLLELRDSEDRMAAASEGAAEAEETARAAVEEARGLRERVQSRAEALLAEAAERADELRAQGRADGLEIVRLAQLEAARVSASAVAHREAEETAYRTRWQEAKRMLEDAERVADRARRRVREDLERQLAATAAWEMQATEQFAADEALLLAADVALQPPDGAGTREDFATESPVVEPDWDSDDHVPQQPVIDDPASEGIGSDVDGRASHPALEELAGLSRGELRELDEPWLIRSEQEPPDAP